MRKACSTQSTYPPGVRRPTMSLRLRISVLRCRQLSATAPTLRQNLRMVDRERRAARIERDIETLAGPQYTRSDEAIRRYAYTSEYRATLDYFTAALRELGFD